MWHSRCPGDTPIPTKPSQACLVWRSWLSIGWSCSGHRQHLLHLATLVTRPDSVISSCGVSSRTMFTSHHLQRHYQNCDSASTPQSGTSNKTCLRGFGGNGSIAWTSVVSHMGRTSNAFKVTMKLQTFLFQMVVTYVFLFSICEYMVLKNPPIIYTHPVYYGLLDYGTV